MNFVGFVKFSVLINREEINSFRVTNDLIMKFSNIWEHIDLFGKFVTMFEKKFNVMYFYRILRDNPHLSNNVCIIFYTDLYQFIPISEQKEGISIPYIFVFLCMFVYFCKTVWPTAIVLFASYRAYLSVGSVKIIFAFIFCQPVFLLQKSNFHVCSSITQYWIELSGWNFLHFLE